MKSELTAGPTRIPRLSLPNPKLFQYSPPPPLPPLSSALQSCGSNNIGSLDASSIEKLLLHCAAALETKDTTLAQQIMWVLNNIASSTGDLNQRLTYYFLKALVIRLCPTTVVPFTVTAVATSHFMRNVRPMSVTELARYIDLTPWHRFGFSAANGAILHAVQGRPKIHILDFGITHCMQWPTLIDELAKRPEGPPSLLRITVPAMRPPVPPYLTASAEQIGFRLANFARSRNICFQLHVAALGSICSGTNPNFMQDFALLDLHDAEALVINCQSWLRYLDSFTKDAFLESLRALNPCVVTITDEDADLDSPSLTSRIIACFNYLWIPFDALETFLPRDSKQRGEYEADVGHKIENVIGFEGEQRIEMLESCARTVQRMKKARFWSVPFGEETLKEVKELLDEHASGWGMKREEDSLVLTWKGHSSVFTTALVPSAIDHE